MKKVIAILLAAALLLTAGCARREEVAPQSAVPGYYGAGQVVEGGSAGQREANYAGLDAARKQEEIVLTLRFTQDGEAADRLPEYRVEGLCSPSRVVVTARTAGHDGLGQDAEPMGEFLGMIEQDKGEDGVQLIFQFTGSVAFKVEEDKGALRLRVRADDAVAVEKYHVKTPYRVDGAQAEEYGLQPVLCDDGISLLLLSEGFDTLEEADAQCNSLNAALEAAGSDDTAEVIRLNSDEAPVYTEPVSRALLTAMGALKTADGVIDGELVATDARFLCRTNDGGLLMARPMVDEETGAACEELWAYSLATGRRGRVTDAVFASIGKAAISKDGRYIAVLEQKDGARWMYLFDRHNEGLQFISAEGMGDYTADFAWGEDNALYAMCGEESMQLMAYDPDAPEEERLRAVEEREGSFGSVGAAGGQVYFNDDAGNIYRVGTDGGEREVFATAEAFLLSPDGTKMLLVTYEAAAEEGAQRLATLEVCDLATDARSVIATGVALSDTIWSGDGEALLYLVHNDGADSEDYPVRLMRYTIEIGRTEEMGALASNSIFQARDKDHVIVTFYRQTDESMMPITYRIDLTGGVLDAEDELIVTIEE